MNQFQEFARLSLLGAAAIGRAMELPPLRRPTTFNDLKHQTGAGTARGQRAEVMCRLALDVAQDWSLNRRAGIGQTRNFRDGNSPGLFLAEGRGANPCLANNHTLRECVRKCVAKGSERHSYLRPSVSHQHGTEGVGSAQEIIGVYQNDDC